MQPDAKRNNMADQTCRRPVFRKDVLARILKLAWPAILEQILVMMGGIVVTIFLGRYGTNELAAAGLVNMIMVVLQTAFSGLATGSTVVIARMIGEGDRRGSRDALFQSMFLAISLSLVITSLAWLGMDSILAFFFRDVGMAVQNLAAVYFRYMLISMPFLTLDLTVAASMRGAGDTLTPMAATGVGSIINITLCSVLIGRMGMTGAGIALCSSRIAACLFRLAMVFLRRQRIYLSFKEKYHLNPELIRRIYRQGMPAFIEQVIMQSGFLMMNTILASLGATVLASWQVGVNMNSLASMPIFGLGVATTTCVGQALGSNRLEDADDYARESLRLAIVVISALGILAAALASPLAQLYSSDPAVIANAIVLIRFFLLTEPLIAIITINASALRAGGDIAYVTATALIGLWLFRILIAMLLVRQAHFGLYGIMIGLLMDYIVRAALYWRRVRRGRWKYRQV